ncbi:hypothetical protein FRC09_008438 [Ceratobasidium sp. 395]|nr:hypothetical protein FRC09_008438 [Ceratobasidium sp. 395]
MFVNPARQYVNAISRLFNLAPKQKSPIGILPDEILLHIAKLSVSTSSMLGTNPDHLPLVLVSKKLNNICTPLLYEYVCLDSPLQFSDFLQSQGVKRNLDRVLVLNIGRKVMFGYWEPLGGVAWPQLLSPLTGMLALRELIIGRGGDSFIHNKTQHPVLEYLTAHSAEPGFLPSLTTLVVRCHPSVLSLCRSRPIKELTLAPNERGLADLFQVHVPEIGHIQGSLDKLSLSIPVEMEAEQVITTIRQLNILCPRLRVISLLLHDHFLPWGSSCFEDGFVNWAQTTLARWSELTDLSICIPQPSAIPMWMEESIIHALAKTFNNLKHVVLPVEQSEWARASTYDDIPDWTPRPDCEHHVMQWWLDTLGLNLAYIKSIDDPTCLENQPGWLKLDEDVSKVHELMRGRWVEEKVPLKKMIKHWMLRRERLIRDERMRMK